MLVSARLYQITKEEEMSELVQFVRGRHGQPRGVLVAQKEGIGWSAVHPRDRFDKQLSLHIARKRIEKGCRITPPSHIRKSLGRFKNRAQRYFRREF